MIKKYWFAEIITKEELEKLQNSQRNITIIDVKLIENSLRTDSSLFVAVLYWEYDNK